MSSLNYFLDRIDQSSSSIQGLKFDAPGIFTNAIIKKPLILQLLKDANYNESRLYKVRAKDGPSYASSSEKVQQSQVNLESERVDGKCYYIEPETEDGDNDTAGPAVKIPRVAKGSKRGSDSELGSSPTKIAKKVDAVSDINEIYRLLVTTRNKIPHIDDDEQFVNEIELLKKTHDGLVEEINTLERVAEDQKAHLRSSNIDFRSSEFDLDNSSEVDIDQLIQQEEEELEQLERQLRG